MRSRFIKDPSIVGKLSNKRLELSFSLPKEEEEKNVSAILPVIHSKQSLGKKRQSTNRIKIEKKPSIISTYQEEGDKPLPQIRISFSKLYELKRAIRKNPEEEYFPQENQYQMTQMRRKRDLVGHLYSPRSMSLVEPGFIKHQKVNQSRLSGMKNTKQSRVKFRETQNSDFLEQLRQHKNIKVKMVDYNKNFNESGNLSRSFRDEQTQVMLSSSRDLHQLSKQQSTQSRIIPIEPPSPDVEKQPDIQIDDSKEQKREEEKNLKISLKNEGKEGYFQLRQEQNQEEQPYDELSFLWEENYIEPKDTQLTKHTFFLEEEQEGSILTFITLATSISDLKIMLIEPIMTSKISFQFPLSLLNTITENISQSQVHSYAETIFSHLRKDFKPQLISFTIYDNCILVTTKISNEGVKSKINRLALLWYYSGRVYVGQWSDINCSQGHLGWKQGLGLQFYPSNYIYYGSFNKNDREGFGVMKKPSKEVYIGEWSANKRSGWGKVFDGSGQLFFDGDFEDGRFKEERLHKD